MIEMIKKKAKKAAKFVIYWMNVAFCRTPCLRVTRTSKPIVRLGSSYGGWYLVDEPDLRGANLVSCGLGEDATFDIQFVKRYGAKALLLDPTPRAIVYFRKISERIGQPCNGPSIVDSSPDPNWWDLSSLSQGDLRLVPLAVWIGKMKVRFYCPRDKSHVSHSITNFQNNYRQDGDFIEVEADELASILRTTGLDDVKVLKLDIEGAETSVLPHFLESWKGNLPGQILVEYDELSKPSLASAKRIRTCHSRLISAGYSLMHVEGFNHLYHRTPT